jgi:hypothetical protein
MIRTWTPNPPEGGQFAPWDGPAARMGIGLEAA